MKNIFLLFIVFTLAGCQHKTDDAISQNQPEIKDSTNIVVLYETTNTKTIKSELFDSLELQIVTTQKGWFEYLQLVKKSGGAVLWSKKDEFDSLGLSIHSARFIEMKGFDYPTFEIYNQSHAGNGNINLYRLRKDKVYNLFCCKAVDIGNLDGYGITLDTGLTYKDGVLKPIYSDLNNDHIDDIILNGVGYVFQDTVLVDSTKISRTFTWNSKEGRFIEDKTKRKGLKYYRKYTGILD